MAAGFDSMFAGGPGFEMVYVNETDNASKMYGYGLYVNETYSVVAAVRTVLRYAQLLMMGMGA